MAPGVGLLESGIGIGLTTCTSSHVDGERQAHFAGLSVKLAADSNSGCSPFTCGTMSKETTLSDQCYMLHNELVTRRMYPAPDAPEAPSIRWNVTFFLVEHPI